MTESDSGRAIDYGRIEEMVEKLVNAIRPPLEPGEDDPVALRAEYQVAVELIKLLSDIRFRCLVFVTAITAIANALLPVQGDAGMKPALGVLGLLATLGITIYELRNSQLYETTVHRAKNLEARLQMKGSSVGVGTAGLFGERPSYVYKHSGSHLEPLMPFWFVPVKHDHGLAFITGLRSEHGCI